MKLGGKLRAYLFTGIWVTAPVAITFYMAYKFILWVDRFVNQLIPPQYQLDNYLPFTIPGLGLVILIVALTLVGMFAAGFLGSFSCVWENGLFIKYLWFRAYIPF